MKAQFNIDSLFKFLQKACSSAREMQALAIEEIQDAVKQMPLLNKINDKGLLILMLAKILHEKYVSFPRMLTVLLNEMFPIEKLVKVRRSKEDDQSRPRRRRKTKKGMNRDLDLNELSNESISNPTNVLNPVEVRDAAPLPDESSKGSKPSNKQAPIQINFQQVISNLERQYDVNGQLTNPEQLQSSQSSSTTSQSARFGVIANLSKKVDIVGLSVSFDENNRTVRRGRNNQSVNRTTKRKIERILDPKINLDETATSLSRIDRLDITTEMIQNRHNFFEEYANYRGFEDRLEKCADVFEATIFNERNRQKIQRFIKKVKGSDHREMQQPTVFHENTDFTDFQATSYVPTASTMFEPPDSTYREHLDSNIFQGEQRVTLKELQSRVKKPKWQIFQNLLWLSQQGQVILDQPNPQQFGDITILRERTELKA